MLDDRFSRLGLLIGEDSVLKLNNSKVILFGVGGVGSYVAESLIRSGIGNLTIVDFDVVNITNINRQILALTSTVGQDKADVMKARLLDINPKAIINIILTFVEPDMVAAILACDYDYVCDAIDFVPTKLSIIKYCYDNHIAVISSMGTGNKLDPEMLTIADISKTSVCPLSRSVRKGLREVGISSGIDVLFSKEKPISTNITENNKRVVGSTAFVPASAGLLIASFIVRNLIK